MSVKVASAPRSYRRGDSLSKPKLLEHLHTKRCNVDPRPYLGQGGCTLKNLDSQTFFVKSECARQASHTAADDNDIAYRRR